MFVCFNLEIVPGDSRVDVVDILHDLDGQRQRRLWRGRAEGRGEDVGQVSDELVGRWTSEQDWILDVLFIDTYNKNVSNNNNSNIVNNNINNNSNIVNNNINIVNNKRKSNKNTNSNNNSP